MEVPLRPHLQLHILKHARSSRRIARTPARRACVRDAIARLLKRAGSDRRRVRAFGEMVALLWAEGHCGATVRLEHLWHRFCIEENLSLLCAYPRSGLTSDASASIRQICDAHSHIASRDGFFNV